MKFAQPIIDKSLVTHDIQGTRPKFLEQNIKEMERHGIEQFNETLLQSLSPTEHIKKINNINYSPKTRQGYHENFASQFPLPQGNGYFIEGNRKAYDPRVNQHQHRSEIHQINALQNPYDIRDDAPLQKYRDRNLDVNDIEGTKPGTLISKVVKNKDTAQKIKTQQNPNHNSERDILDYFSSHQTQKNQYKGRKHYFDTNNPNLKHQQSDQKKEFNQPHISGSQQQQQSQLYENQNRNDDYGSQQNYKNDDYGYESQQNKQSQQDYSQKQIQIYNQNQSQMEQQIQQDEEEKELQRQMEAKRIQEHEQVQQYQKLLQEIEDLKKAKAQQEMYKNDPIDTKSDDNNKYLTQDQERQAFNRNQSLQFDQKQIDQAKKMSQSQDFEDRNQTQQQQNIQQNLGVNLQGYPVVYNKRVNPTNFSYAGQELSQKNLDFNLIGNQIVSRPQLELNNKYQPDIRIKQFKHYPGEIAEPKIEQKETQQIQQDQFKPYNNYQNKQLRKRNNEADSKDLQKELIERIQREEQITRNNITNGYKNYMQEPLNNNNSTISHNNSTYVNQFNRKTIKYY